MLDSSEGDRGVAAAALVAIVVITVAWWMLALYPVGADAPEWVLRTRMACFGNGDTGLPHAGGWVLLVGEPLGMVGTLYAVWGRALRRDLSWLRGVWAGRLLLGAMLLVIVGGSVQAAQRVGRVMRAGAGAAEEVPVVVVPPSERAAAPALALVDQHGATFDLASLRGAPALVTFAFGHCETVCPTIVREVRTARTAAGVVVPLVVVTVDPWRDVPERLTHVAAMWELSGEDRVLSGSVGEVLRVVGDWGVTVERDAQTGDVTHPALVVLVDARGRVAARLPGDLRPLPALLRD